MSAAAGPNHTDAGVPVRWPDRDLTAVVAVSAFCALVAVLIHVTVIRAVAVVPLCLVLPGYALTGLIFARTQLETAAKAMLVFGLSLITLVLSSLILNEFPGGLREGTWAGWLVALTLVECGVTQRRRWVTVDAPALPLAPVGAGWNRFRAGVARLRMIDMALVLVALIIAIGAIVASRWPLGAKNVVGYETLTLVPTAADTGVEVGLLSGRQHAGSYHLVVRVGTKTALNRTMKLSAGGEFKLGVVLGSSTVSRAVTATVTGPAHTSRSANVTVPAG